MASLLPILFATAFAALLCWAAACDVATMEIPNRISVIAVGLYPIAALACGIAWQAVLIHLGVGVGALVFTWALFYVGVFGGGDAKLMAAAAVWTGPLLLAPFVLWTCVAGGALAAIAMVARRSFKPSPDLPSFVNRFLSEKGLPYAVAIAIGGLVILMKIPLVAGA